MIPSSQSSSLTSSGLFLPFFPFAVFSIKRIKLLKSYLTFFWFFVSFLENFLIVILIWIEFDKLFLVFLMKFPPHLHIALFDTELMIDNSSPSLWSICL